MVAIDTRRISRFAPALLAAAALALAALLGALALSPDRAEAGNTVLVKGCTGTGVRLTVAEKRMLGLHNRARAEHGLRRLCVHPALKRAARAHSREMIEKDYFSHDSHNGTPSHKRITNSGYKNWRAVGENIARGSGPGGVPANTFDAWMRSPGHRANILNKDYREIGIGAASGELQGSENVTVWTADFGARHGR